MNRRISKMTRVAMLGVFLAISVYMLPPIQLTLLPVPFTFQLVMVLLISLMFPMDEAVGSILLYLLLGAMGLPVFSGGLGGIAKLFSPTGGFLWSFVLVAGFISAFHPIHQPWLHQVVIQVGAVYGIMYPLAITWLALQTLIPWIEVGISLVPFMAIDLVKIAVTTWLVYLLPKNLVKK